MLGDPPKNTSVNRLWRGWLLDLGRRRKRVREYLSERSTHDIHFWINTFVYQFNPNYIAGGQWEEMGPFVSEPWQDRALDFIGECITEKRDCVIDKSREMGASWMCLLKMCHSILWERWKKYLCISRNIDAVDDPGDSDSLFWKVDFVLERLPEWMTEGFDFNAEGKIKRIKMLIPNRKTNSNITGQASTGAAGVGGRATAMFVDEFSRIREDYDVLSSTANTTGCRIFNGTQQGTEKAFYELTEMGKRGLIRKLDLHWTLHPDKWKGAYRFDKKHNRIEVLDKTYSFPVDFKFVYSEAPAGGPQPGIRSPYYDDQCIKQVSPRAIAMNLDMDAAGSVAQVFNPLVVRDLIATYAEPPKWEGELQYDLATGRPHKLVPVPGGPLKLWINPPADGRFPPLGVGLGNDISAGTGASNSVLCGASKITGEKMIEYATPHMAPEAFAELASAIGWLFCDEYNLPALLCWESNGPGKNFEKRLLELGYPNPWRRNIKMSTGQTSKSDLLGWQATNETKALLLRSYMFAISTRQFIERSKECLEETLAYRYDGSGNIIHPGSPGQDPSGAKVGHGDRVIASSQAWMLIQELGYTVEITERELKRSPPPNSIAGRMRLNRDQENRSSWAESSL